MAKFNYSQSSFRFGEISPRLYGRTDLEQYQGGLAKLENFFPLIGGGAIFRPGSRYVINAKQATPANSADFNLMPFVFSKTESYVAALSPSTHQGLQVFKNDGTVCVVTGSADILSLTATEVFEVHYAQSADVMYIVHRSRKPAKLKRTATTTFVIQDYDVLDSGVAAKFTTLRYPYRDKNITTTTITPSGTTGSVTLTASAALFNSTQIGAIFKITQGTTTGSAQITAFTSTTVVTATVLVAFGATTASDNWEESSWSNYRGWPGAVTLFEGRIIFGGNSSQPDTIWASLVGNYDHLMQSSLIQDASTDASGLNYFGSLVETDPFIFTLASREVNDIQWLSSGRTLNIGTLGEEYGATGGQNRVLSALNVSIVPQTNYGSNKTLPSRVNQTTVFVSRDGKRLYEFYYDFQNDSHVANDLSLIADHMSEQQTLDNLDEVDGYTSDVLPIEFRQIQYQQSRNLIWCRTSKNNLVALALQKDLNQVAWARVKLGGQFDSGSSKFIHPNVISFCIIPGTSSNSDDVWMCVKRTIDGVSSTYIEKIGPDFKQISLDNGSSSNDELPWFADSAVKVTRGTAGTSFAGFDHLKNELVAVLADGFYVGMFTIDSAGVLTLNENASIVLVGLPYVGTIKSLRLEAGADAGSSQGYLQRFDQVAIKFDRTWGGSFGRDNLEELNFNEPAPLMDTPVTLFSGEKVLDFPGGFDSDNFIQIQQSLPLPMTVLCWTVRGAANG